MLKDPMRNEVNRLSVQIRAVSRTLCTRPFPRVVIGYARCAGAGSRNRGRLGPRNHGRVGVCLGSMIFGLVVI